MKQTLAVRMGTQLAMTPQLRQAIRLMQLSALELNVEITEQLESNPMLELVEDADAPEAEASTPEAEAAASDEDDAERDIDLGGGAGDDARPDTEDAALADIPDDLPVDVSWEDVYQPSAPGEARGSRDESDEPPLAERSTGGESLRDHLLWQLNLTPLSDRDRLAGLVIVDSIDEDGMLEADIDELVAALNDGALFPEAAPHQATLLGGEPFHDAEVRAVLKRIQQFDPPGVGARDLAECLLLQLRQLPRDTPWRKEAIVIVRDHFRLLASRDSAALARRTRLTDLELTAVMRLIQSLNPRPGTSIGNAEIEYVEPDVIVSKQEGRWRVELNPRNQPRLRVNGLYARLVKPADNSADNQYLKNNLQEAKWFMKNLAYRNETLLRVGNEIVRRQRGFLERGEEAMQPLVLSDIAEAVDRHESTISRVTTRKYMETPRGIFELKYFFSSHVNTVNGGEVSSTAIRALIKRLTAEENPRKPLSDSKIATVLKDRGIEVARRTVAKYRESLAIPSSTERRRLA